jgi:hypothetical protein
MKKTNMRACFLLIVAFVIIFFLVVHNRKPEFEDVNFLKINDLADAECKKDLPVDVEQNCSLLKLTFLSYAKPGIFERDNYSVWNARYELGDYDNKVYCITLAVNEDYTLYTAMTNLCSERIN